MTDQITPPVDQDEQPPVVTPPNPQEIDLTQVDDLSELKKPSVAEAVPAVPGELTSAQLNDLEKRAQEAEAIVSELGSTATTVGDITIDMGELTLGDLETLEKASRKELSTTELISFLDRVVVSGAKNLKLSDLPKITQALIAQTRKLSNPGN
jgi:hypothetical protein